MKKYALLEKIFIVWGKTTLIFVLGLVALIICLVTFLYAAEWIWPEFNGSYNLGNNIYMLEWDGGGRIIVSGTNISGKTCYGGENLIPTYENSVDSNGHFTEYVVDAKSDERWVIVKTDNYQSKQRKYYIINKDYDPNEMTAQDIIDTKIECFTDSSEFANKCLENEISITW